MGPGTGKGDHLGSGGLCWGSVGTASVGTEVEAAGLGMATAKFYELLKVRYQVRVSEPQCPAQSWTQSSGSQTSVE